MKQSTAILSTVLEKSQAQQKGPSSLPRWEQIPPEYQREVVMTLATMLIKRLSLPQPGSKEGRDE
jgi:hypothetical protein